jgi:hypothetical protein
MLIFIVDTCLSEEHDALCVRAMYCPSVFSERRVILELILIGKHPFKQKK